MDKVPLFQLPTTVESNAKSTYIHFGSGKYTKCILSIEKSILDNLKSKMLLENTAAT